MFMAGAAREQKSFEGGLQGLEFKKITEPCASFLLMMTFSYTLYDGYFFLLGVSLTLLQSHAALHGEFLLQS